MGGKNEKDNGVNNAAWELPDGLKSLVGFFGEDHTRPAEYMNSTWKFMVGKSILEVEKINKEVCEIKTDIIPNEELGKRSVCSIHTDTVIVINNNPLYGKPTIKFEDGKQIAIVSIIRREGKDDLMGYFEVKKEPVAAK